MRANRIPPQIVILAKAGIQRGGEGGKTAASLGPKACPGLRSGIGDSRRIAPRTRQSGPPIVIPAKAGIQRGGGRQDRRQSWHEN